MLNTYALWIFVAYLGLVFLAIYLTVFWRALVAKKLFVLLALGFGMLTVLVATRPLLFVAEYGLVESSVEFYEGSVRVVNTTIVPRYVATPYGDQVFTACLMCVLVVMLMSMITGTQYAIRVIGK